MPNTISCLLQTPPPETETAGNVHDDDHMSVRACLPSYPLMHRCLSEMCVSTSFLFIADPATRD